MKVGNRWIVSLLLLFFMVANLYASFPLPNRSVAQTKGLSGGIGLGSLSHSGCKNLWTWSTQGKFSYDSTITAGPSVKFSGGNLDSTKNLVYQRYSINVAFNQIHQKYAIFAGPSFSFENTTLSNLIDEFSYIGKQQDKNLETRCSELFSEIGSSIGYQSGMGFLLNPDWGLTLGHTFDLTFKGVYLISFSCSIAFNMRNYFEKLVENTKNVWLSLEYSTSFTRKSFSIQELIFGFALGF